MPGLEETLPSCRTAPAPAERITAAIKSLPLRLTGYSGLMLPLCEDSGLVAAANEGRLSIGSLLHYSGGANGAWLCRRGLRARGAGAPCAYTALSTEPRGVPGG